MPETQHRERRRRVLTRLGLPLRAERLVGGPPLGQYDLELPGRRALDLILLDLSRHLVARLPHVRVSVSTAICFALPGSAALRRRCLPLLFSLPQPSAQAYYLLAEGLERGEGGSEAHAGEQGKAKGVKQPDRERGPDGAGPPLHDRVDSTAEKAPGLGVMPGGEQLPVW